MPMPHPPSPALQWQPQQQQQQWHWRGPHPLHCWRGLVLPALLLPPLLPPSSPRSGPPCGPGSLVGFGAPLLTPSPLQLTLSPPPPCPLPGRHPLPARQAPSSAPAAQAPCQQSPLFSPRHTLLFTRALQQLPLLLLLLHSAALTVPWPPATSLSSKGGAAPS
jgi:hypothetical protein